MTDVRGLVRTTRSAATFCLGVSLIANVFFASSMLDDLNLMLIELGKIPEIVECHFTTGPYTMLTKVYARDNEHLMDLLNNKMQEIPGVTATETLISLEQSIKKEIPICPEK